MVRTAAKKPIFFDHLDAKAAQVLQGVTEIA